MTPARAGRAAHPGDEMIIIDDIEQYSVGWWAARAGIPTSSCFDMILTPKTMKPSSQQEKYLYTLAGERITGTKAETYQSAAMERGLIMEAEARTLFEMVQDVEVKQVAFIYSDDKRYGCSPDGLLDHAGLEIKCPNMSTHVGYLLDGGLPGVYVPQVQGSMLITGFSHWFFLSYYPGLPPLLLKISRDDKFCAALKVELDGFCGRLNEVERKLRELA